MIPRSPHPSTQLLQIINSLLLSQPRQSSSPLFDPTIGFRNLLLPAGLAVSWPCNGLIRPSTFAFFAAEIDRVTSDLMVPLVTAARVDEGDFLACE